MTKLMADIFKTLNIYFFVDDNENKFLLDY